MIQLTEKQKAKLWDDLLAEADVEADGPVSGQMIGPDGIHLSERMEYMMELAKTEDRKVEVESVFPDEKERAIDAFRYGLEDF